MILKLDIFQHLGMIVVGDRAVAVASIAAVEKNPFGGLDVFLVNGKKMLFQDKDAVALVDKITEGVHNAQRIQLSQASQLIR